MISFKKRFFILLFFLILSFWFYAFATDEPQVENYQKLLHNLDKAYHSYNESQRLDDEFNHRIDKNKSRPQQFDEGNKLIIYLENQKNYISETEFQNTQLRLAFWMEKAGKGSTKEVKYWLAESFYEAKNHFPKDSNKGDKWCLKAAKLGHTKAQDTYTNILKQNGIVPLHYTMEWYSSQNQDVKAKEEYLLGKFF